MPLALRHSRMAGRTSVAKASFRHSSASTSADLLWWRASASWSTRSEEHTSELQSLRHLVCRLLLEKKKPIVNRHPGLSENTTPAFVHGPRPRAPTRAPGPWPRHNKRTSPTTYHLLPRFFFNDTAPTEISPLSLPDALPISTCWSSCGERSCAPLARGPVAATVGRCA